MIRDNMSLNRLRPSFAHWRTNARRSLRYLAVATFLGLTACAAQEIAPQATVEAPAEKSEVARMYATVLDNVHNMYLDELPVAKLALSGLAGLSKLEPGEIGRAHV